MTGPEPKFDKDIELAKINLVAEEWRGSLLTSVGTLLSAMIAIFAVVSASELTRQLTFLASLTIIVVVGAYFVSVMYVRHLRPYQKRIQQLDVLLKKVYNGEPIGDVEDLLKKK